VSTNKFRERLAAALPVREVRQPKASLPTLGSISAWDSVDAGATSGGATGASSLSNVLQSTLKEASSAVTQSNKQLTDLQALHQQMLASTNQNIQALNANTTAKGSTGSSAMSTVGNLASSILGQGSILTPIISGVMKLFGGGQTSSQPAFAPFIMPPSMQLETAVNNSVTPAGQTSPVTSNGGAPPAAPAPHVQIQVNAIDSRSFLDHSDAIAEAVRQALLNSHSLGDVIAGM